MSLNRMTMRSRLPIIAAFAMLVGACDDTAAGPEPAPVTPTTAAARVVGGDLTEANVALATLRRATAKYHDLDAAIADGFQFLHPCEERPGEGPVGIVYVHMGRLTDGAIDPALPDALVYEPSANGKPKLVAAELAVPYVLWPHADPPSFLGATFGREDEFGVYGLHVWIWRHNPEGMFAEANPRVSCEIV